MNKAKEQLASGEVTIMHTSQKITTKQIPEWLFDLATLRDDCIFDGVTETKTKKQIEKMSRAMFSGLLIAFRAEHR